MLVYKINFGNFERHNIFLILHLQ